MDNFSSKLNLRQLKHAVITTKQGNKALVIPIKENQLFDGEKGTYLELMHFPYESKTNDTHLIKQSFDKEFYKNLTKEEKEAFPILGNSRVWKKQEQDPNNIDISIDESDDLPF